MAIDIIRAQVVTRDFNLIENSHALVVYHHGEHPSYGVMAEVMRASQLNKPVYVLYPYKKRLSPFFEFYASSSFASEERILSKISEPLSELKELEDKLVNLILYDACKGRWPTWTITKEFKEKYCSQFY